MAHSSLRLGIGRFTTEAEIDLAVDLLEKHVNRCVIRCCTLLHCMVLRSMRVSRLREMSPLWEMVFLLLGSKADSFEHYFPLQLLDVFG